MKQPFLLSSGAIAVIVLAQALGGCSSAKSEGDETGGTGGTSGGTAGSSGTTGGTDPGTGGTDPGTGGTTGGTDPGTGGTTAGTGTGGDTAGHDDPRCRGISRGTACTYEGLSCVELPCGIADVGDRQCDCATTWNCTSCAYPDPSEVSILEPGTFDACDTTMAEGLPCAEQGARCQPTDTTEFCACWPDDENELIWDCDDKPWE